jgi:hypothetical protein
MPDIWMDVDTALASVPVNIFPLTDDTDFKTRETSVAYNAGGMDLVWNFVTTGGVMTQTAVTPTTSGVYDWAHAGDGMYTIEIPASGGASINNDAEGFGWFSGVCTGVMPWRGPIIGFRSAGLNNAMVDNAYSTTRGLAGTALPDAAAEAAGGVYTRGTGAGQINQPANGRIDTNVVAQDNIDFGVLQKSSLNAATPNLNAAYDAAKTAAQAAELAKVPKSDSNVTWNATALASINAEVVDVLNVDTYAEPAQGAPPATASIVQKIGYWYKAWRNKTETTSTEISIYNDAGTTVDHKSTISDNGTTTTKGEFITGA